MVTAKYNSTCDAFTAISRMRASGEWYRRNAKFDDRDFSCISGAGRKICRCFDHLHVSATAKGVRLRGDKPVLGGPAVENKTFTFRRRRQNGFE